MTISIAMATYNGERFLREQLDSLAAQTRLPDELVVSDDGSSDRTLEIVREFSRTAPFPVRIYQNDTKLGYGDNFLHAAGACHGDWVAFCDQDDHWLPNKLATVEAHFRVPGRDVVLVVHNAMVVDESLAASGVEYPGIKRARVSKGSDLPTLWFTGGLTMVFRSDLVTRCSTRERGPSHGFPGEPLAHDAWICWLACILGDIVMLPEVLVLYRRHSATTTTKLKGSVGEIRASRHALRVMRAALVGRDAATYRHMSEAMLCHGRALGRIGSQQREGPWRHKLLTAGDRYRSLAIWLAERGAARGEVNVASRIHHLSRAVLTGGYGRFYGAKKSLGVRALIKDFCVSILGDHRLGRLFGREAGN
jgi:glycosyltransferase involved in cell wall biosynthesis